MKTRLTLNPTKIKNMQGFAAKQKHNVDKEYRKTHVKNADPSRVDLQEELISLNGKSMGEAFKDRLKELPYYQDRKVRADAVLGFELVMSMGAEFDKDGNVAYPDDFDLEKWKEANIEWLKDMYGEENVLSAVLHLDETMPHIHAVIVPVDEKGHLNSRDIIGGKQGLAKMHESYDKAMEEFGFERSRKHDKSMYKDLQDFYAAVNEAKLYQLPDVEKGETAEHYFDRAQDAFTNRNYQNMDKMDKLTKKINAMEKEAQTRNEEYANTLSELQTLRTLFGEGLEANKKKIKVLNHLKAGFESYPNEAFAETIYEGLNEIYEKECIARGEYDMIDALNEVFGKSTDMDSYEINSEYEQTITD